MTPLLALAAVVAAYVVGALPIGYLVARVFGVQDLRRHGSGNIGATNVLRTAGRLPAALTLLGDIVKGYAAVAQAAMWVGDEAAVMVSAVAAVAAVAGNCWSPFLGLGGGKGVATGLGALLRLVPVATLPAALVWLAVSLTFRYASLGSLTAAACIPLGAWLLRYPPASILAAVGCAAIIVVRHRDNIARLVAGTERRLGERA